MRVEKEIRKEIFDKVIEVYQLKKRQEKFIPGEAEINYTGRVVYDEKELINLVDASQDPLELIPAFGGISGCRG